MQRVDGDLSLHTLPIRNLRGCPKVADNKEIRITNCTNMRDLTGLPQKQPIQLSLMSYRGSVMELFKPEYKHVIVTSDFDADQKYLYQALGEARMGNWTEAARKYMAQIYVYAKSAKFRTSLRG